MYEVNNVEPQGDLAVLQAQVSFPIVVEAVPLPLVDTVKIRLFLIHLGLTDQPILSS